MTNPDSWLSLSKAAQFLGVHFTTLRRWADQGLIEYIRTPGGKRKFQQRAIDDFIERHRSGVQAPAGWLQIREDTVVRTRQDVQEHGLANQGWYLHLSDDQRLQMRRSGSTLIALILQYCSREANDEVFLEEGRRLAVDYGRICFAMGQSLAECIRTFLFFRKSMLSAIHETGSLRGMGDAEGVRLFEKMNYFLDESMIAMVVAYGQL